MSLKPPKKSDLGKAWMSKRRDSQRMIDPQYHLIVTEGTKTEPKYFEAVKRFINSNHREHIQLEISGIGDNTVNLFQRAKDLADKSLNGYRHVWIVYDTDDFPPEHINLVVSLCENASSEERTFHAVWSNQCIELWFLLHFCFMQSDIHRTEYFEKLSEHLQKLELGDYQKNRDDMYAILRPRLQTAIQNSERLAAMNKGKTPTESAPGTMVHEIMKMFAPYLP